MSDTHCADCGAEFKPAGCGTGYAVTAAGNRICYECCAKRDRAEMLATGRATLYLTGDHDTAPEATNWPGTLRFQCGAVRRSRHNVARWRYDTWFIGPDGHRWHGVQYGDNTQILHCRKTAHVPR